MKKGPGELLAVANYGSLQLGAVVSLEPHEIGDGIVVQKLVGVGVGITVDLGGDGGPRKGEAGEAAVGVGGGSRWERACQFRG